MTQLIIYPQDNGEVAIMIPTDLFPIEEVAKKDVPAGKPYLIVDAADLSADWEFSPAWVVDFSNPHGTGLGHDAWAAQYVDPMASHDEAHAENACRDMWPVLIAMAEQDNRQWDAMQAMKDDAS